MTVSDTEVEFWSYSRGFLEHAREIPRVPRDPDAEREARRRDNLNATRNTIRRLVNSNVRAYGYEPCFLTFTYRENQGDIDIAWSDWHEFMRKMRSYFGKLHALSVMEFQKRGAVHFHCIFFNLSPEVESRERSERLIAFMWGHGFVDIERVRSAKNVGAYVCKYLNKSADDERLKGKKFFSTTKGLLRPKTYTGVFAFDRFCAMVERGDVELLAQTEYAYGGMPVQYSNYKINEEQNVHDRRSTSVDV